MQKSPISPAFRGKFRAGANLDTARILMFLARRMTPLRVETYFLHDFIAQRSRIGY